MSITERAAPTVAPDWLTEILNLRASEPERKAPIIKGRWIWVDPPVAEGLLILNTWNRKIAPLKVKEYADLMRDGLWDEQTPQLIVFDEEQRMADGQHRCHAIIKSGRAFWVLVCWDTPSEARLNIDRHRPRAAWDNMVMSGALPASDHGTERDLTHLCNAYLQGMMPTKVSLPAARVAQMVDVHGPWLRDTLQMFGTKRSGATRAIVKAVVARAMSHHVNRGQLTRFVNLLLNGVAERPEDVTVIRYRDRLIETRHKVNSNGNQELYALGVSALRSFLRGEVRQYIRPLSDDPYPLKTNGPTATGPDLATDFLDRMALDDGRGRDGAGGPLSH